MAIYSCPKGHSSSDPDYCSECGLRMQAGASAAAVTQVTPAPQVDLGSCPDCGTPRLVGARFCEVCRHDFSAATATVAAPPPTAAPCAPDPVPAPAAVAAAVIAPAAGKAWTENLWAIIRCDRSMVTNPDPATPFPEGEPDRAFPLDLDEMLLGRRNGRRDVHPEIAIADPSISSRHLKISRQPDGGRTVVDVGSSNGTKLNGVVLQPGVEMPLKTGDQLELGMWTRILIEAR